MAALILLAIFPLLMAYAAASDLFTMTIPNVLSMALLAAFAVVAVCGGLVLPTVLWNILACVVVLAATFGMFALGWIGGGDAKLAAATALWIGFEQLPAYLFGVAILGGGLTLLIVTFRVLPLPQFAAGWAWLKRLHDPAAGVPYGIALACGAILVYPYTQIWTTLAPH